MQRSIDYSKLIFYDEIDENIQMSVVSPPENRKADVDFATSVITYSERFWGGITVDHMLRANQSLYGEKSLVPIKYSAFGGVKIPLKERLLLSYAESLTLGFLYNQQGDYSQFQLGSYYHKNPLVFGLWYRGIPLFKNNAGSDAVIFLMGYKIDNLSVGYSYDFTISPLRNMTGGSHEISFIWNFKLREWQKKPTSVPCPEF
jgi:type IX secretion system PorP/SprF family membrane protein